MKCPICGKDLDLQNKQIGTSENGDPIFNEYAICHSCKSNGTLINNVQRRSLPRKPQKRKQKLRLRLVPLKRRQKLKLPPALLKKKRKLKLLPVPLRRKRKLMLPPVPLKRNELPAEKQKPAPAKKRLPALLLTKGFQKKKLNVFLRREPSPQSRCTESCH